MFCLLCHEEGNADEKDLECTRRFQEGREGRVGLSCHQPKAPFPHPCSTPVPHRPSQIPLFLGERGGSEKPGQQLRAGRESLVPGRMGRASMAELLPATLHLSSLGWQLRHRAQTKRNPFLGVSPLLPGSHLMSQNQLEGWTPRKTPLLRPAWGSQPEHRISSQSPGRVAPTLAKEAEVVTNNLPSAPPSPNLVVNRGCFVQRRAPATGLTLMKSRPSLTVAPPWATEIKT